MPADFETGFFVREPAWHGLGVVLDDYPGREEAMRLAGHDFMVTEHEIAVGKTGEEVIGGPNDGATEEEWDIESGWKALRKDGIGKVFTVVKDSYTVIQNDVGWDIVDAIVGEGAKYETGITLKGGSVCSVLAYLDEPVTIPGDDSTILPYLNVSWTHDGSGALTSRSTSIRTVCSNTQSAAELEGRRLGTDYTFRHTKNVMARIEDAKEAVLGMRIHHQEYIDLANELAQIQLTEAQRELFVCEFIPTPEEYLISKRVQANIDKARNQVRAILDGSTVPEPHRYTGYGAQLAGVEFLDHVRPAHSPETKFGRSLLRNEPLKAKLTTVIRDVAKELV